VCSFRYDIAKCEADWPDVGNLPPSLPRKDEDLTIFESVDDLFTISSNW
jgi:hypothetical protein